MTTIQEPAAAVLPFSLHQRVARNVRAELARNEVTQAQAAQACGMQQQGMSLRLRGKVPFTLNELEVIAALVNVTPEDLVVGSPGPGNGPDYQAAGVVVVRHQGLEPRTR